LPASIPTVLKPEAIDGVSRSDDRLTAVPLLGGLHH
jgi:hypothetical protein